MESSRSQTTRIVKRSYYQRTKKHEQTKCMEYCSDKQNPQRKKNNWQQMDSKNKKVSRYRACLVCLGYTQVPGIDFQDNFAPVVNGMTF